MIAKKLKIVPIVLLLSFIGLPVSGFGGDGVGRVQSEQEPQDSVRQFNALDYSLQKRYRPKNDVFIHEKFTDNTFIGISGGIMNMVGREDLQYGFGPSAMFSLGKWINEYNALRVDLSWMNFVRKDDVGQFNVGGIGMSHMFNISSYLGGYKRTRFFELSTVEGLKFTGSYHDGKLKMGLGLNVGLNFSFRLGDLVDLTVEPGVVVHTDGVDHSGEMNWHRYDLEYGVRAGLNFNLGTRKYEREKVERGSTFIALSGGAQFQNSTLVVKEIGIFKAIGPHAAVSAGRWINDFFALQGTLFYSSDKWIKDELEGVLRDTYYMGARVEAKFDPLMLINGWKEKSGFSVPLIFGGEVGYMDKDDRAQEISQVYLGLTAAVQLKYRLLSFLSVYLEPRFSIVPYHIDFYSDYTHEGIRATYFDGLVNVNFGIEFDITAIKRLLSKAGIE